MAKVELYIDGELCDLSGKESINVDYTNFDVSKIDSRGGARSYSFSLPKTNRNKSVLENPEMINNLSMAPYTRMRCMLYVDGVDMLIRFCEVQSVKDAYSIQLYGANSDMFNDLRDKNLQDLDLSEYDHYWNYFNVLDGLYRTEGYGYGIIDYHSDSPNTFITNDAIFADYMLPFVYVNKILEKMFSGLDYTVINEIESDTVNMVVPAIKQCFRNFDGKRYEGKFTLDRYSIDGYNYIDLNPVIYSFRDIYFNIINSQGRVFYRSGTDSVDNNYYYSDNFSYDLSLTLIIENLSSSTNIDVDFLVTYSDSTYLFTVNTTPGSHTYYHSIRLNIAGDSDTGQQVRSLNVQAASHQGLFIHVMDGSTIEFSNVVINKPLNLNYSDGTVQNKYDYATLSTVLPNITQIEFLKNYMQMFCLLPIVNEISKTIRLVKFDSIATNTINAYDWSNKIDLTEQPEIIFIQNNYGQHNKFIYTQDGDEQKPIGTDGEISIANTNLEFEKTAVELVYAGTKANIRLYDNSVTQIGIFKDGEYDAEKEPRILNVKRGFASSDKQLVDSLSHFTIIGGAVNVPYFIDAQQSFNLGFGDNLLSNYYQLLSDILSKVKVVRQLVRLSAAEMSMLDFSRPVWIAKYESYFYISSVKGFTYTESKSTLVELVKLNLNG